MGKPTSGDDTRELPPLFMRAAFQPGSVDSEKRTAELVWTTGARVKRGFWEPYWEELSTDPSHVRMDRINNGAPLLAAHNGWELGAVLGVVESARLEKGKGVAVVRFAKQEDDPEADKVFRKVKDGILQNISVGYRVHKLERTEKGDPDAGILPVYRATDWEPYEISVVPMGADDGAGFRSSDAQRNPCVIVTRQEQTMPNETEPQKPATQQERAASSVEDLTRAAAEKREREAEATSAASRRAADEAVRLEREREVTIRNLVRQAKLGDELADKLVREGAKLDDVRAAILDHLTRSSDSGPSNHVLFEAGEDQREKFVRGASAAIIERCGLRRTIEAAQKTEHGQQHLAGTSVDAGEFRGMRMLDLARACLERQGASTRSLHGEALIKRALEYRGDAGMNTTSDFAILLETAVNKIFLGQYALTPVTWPRWCGRRSVQDFRTSTFYRPGTFGKLDAVSESGEIKHKQIPDGEKATLTPATKANIIGINRKAMVNDDLGAFRDLASGLGQAAALTVESDAFLLITPNSGLGPTQSDGQPLFHSNRANIGASGAMTATTIDTSRATMAKQKDVSKNQYLDLRPAVWLGPVELGGQARILNTAQYEPTASKFQVPNVCAGLFREVVDSAYLSAVSATRHYLLADPGMYPVFAVGFIDGNEAPQITSEQSFGFDGLQVKVLLDYGTAVLDYRGAVTAPGA